MKLEIGKTYKVKIEDCCVTGEFTSKLVKAQQYDDNDEPYAVNEMDWETELFFENGVRIDTTGGIELYDQ